MILWLILTIITQILLLIVLTTKFKNNDLLKNSFYSSIFLILMLNTLKIRFDTAALNSFLTVSSIFIAISIYLNRLKLIRLSIINFLFILNNYFVCLLNIKDDFYIISIKSIFTFGITTTMLLFLKELIREIEKSKK